MENHKKATFGLNKFKVPSFSYNESKENPKLDLSINVRGKYFKKEGKYELFLEVLGSDSIQKKEIIRVNAVSEFLFSEAIDGKEIPEYFYINSVAIMFPYVRAFISNLTLQANAGMLILETLNLSSLKETLKDSTEFV